MPTSRRIDRPLYEPLGALWDMGASAVRGVTRGTLGLPGDLESIVRMVAGGEQVLPTSQDWDKKLPPVKPLVADMKPYDDISMFYNVPIYGGALSAGSKGIKKLGGKVVGGDYSQSRRNFLKGTAALGAGTAIATKLKFLDDALKEVPDVAKQVDTAKPAAKAASKYKFNSLKEYNDYLNQNSYSEYGSRHFQPEVKRELAEQEEVRYSNIKRNGWDNKGVPFGKDISDIEKNIELVRGKESFEFDHDLYPRGTYWDAKELEMQRETLDAFSPQAKAEMKQFKKVADEYNFDKANTKMYEENPHMYNYPDMDEEVLLEKYLDKTHWSDHLDEYLNRHDPYYLDIPF